MVADTAADMDVHLVTGIVADKVADKQKNILADMELDMEADKEVDKVVDMVAGHGCWLIGPKLFRPESYPYPTCVTSKPCKFIPSEGVNIILAGTKIIWAGTKIIYYCCEQSFDHCYCNINFHVCPKRTDMDNN